MPHSDRPHKQSPAASSGERKWKHYFYLWYVNAYSSLFFCVLDMGCAEVY